MERPDAATSSCCSLGLASPPRRLPAGSLSYGQRCYHVHNHFAETGLPISDRTSLSLAKYDRHPASLAVRKGSVAAARILGRSAAPIKVEGHAAGTLIAVALACGRTTMNRVGEPAKSHKLSGGWSGARVVEEAALEMPCTVSPYRGFESLPLRFFGSHPSTSTSKIFLSPGKGLRRRDGSQHTISSNRPDRYL